MLKMKSMAIWFSGLLRDPGFRRFFPTQRWTMNLRVRLVLLNMVAITVVTLGFAFIHREVWTSWVDEDLRHQAITFSREISATIFDIESPDELEDLKAALFRILKIRGNVLHMDIYRTADPSNQLIASTNVARKLPFLAVDFRRVRNGATVSRLSVVESKRSWQIMVPIFIEDRIVGILRTEFALSEADKLQSRINRWGLAFFFLAICVTGALVTATVTFTVNRPINEFLRTIAAIQQGARANVAVKNDDEFKILASHFNEMMERIESFNQEVLSRIETATAELDVRYIEERRLTELLSTARRNLGHAERLAVAGQMVAEIAHHVGTPLHSVAGHLELMRAHMPSECLNPDTLRRFDIIENQVSRVENIIRQLLNLSRQDPGEMRILDVTGLILDCLDIIQPEASRAGISMIIDRAENLPSVMGIDEHIMHVILNLLSNAIDATPRGGQVVVKTRASEREVKISLSDTGPGIPVEIRNQMFEPFISSKASPHGTGLGLFIADKFVRDHSGRIDVTSQTGKGTTITVILPVAPEAVA